MLRPAERLTGVEVMSVQDAIVIEPGWYPDPAGSGSLRWWSGAGWTDHVSEPVSAPVDEVESAASVVPVAPGPRRAARLARSSGEDVDAPDSPLPGASPVGPQAPASPERESTMAIPAVDPWWVPVTAAEESPASASVPVWRSMPATTTWNSPAAWLLSVLLLISTGIAVIVYLVASGRMAMPAPSGLLVLIVSIALAKRDRRALEERGLDKLPSLWWLLLGPVFYLGARAFGVLKAGGNAWAPFWVALATNVACILVAFVIGFYFAG